MRLLSVPVARFATSRAGTTDLGDLHVYDPVAMAWTDLSAAASGTPPSPRAGHGFTAAGGKLYVHGGCDSGDWEREGRGGRGAAK